jgi:hypothetical protein
MAHSQPNLGHMSQPNLGHMSQPNLDHMSQPNLGHMSQTNLGHMSQTNLGHMSQPNLGHMSQPNLDHMSQTNLGHMSQPTSPPKHEICPAFHFTLHRKKIEMDFDIISKCSYKLNARNKQLHHQLWLPKSHPQISFHTTPT